jgi:hypothetical protein
MNKEEVKRIMAIVRPAVYAVYGRMPLSLTAYSKMGKDFYWVEVEESYPDIEEVNYYKLRIDNGEVTYLNMGELK